MVDIIDYRRGAARRGRLFPFTFTAGETRDLLKSWLALSVAFTLTRISLARFFPEYLLLVVVPVSVIVAGLTFIVHELAHKFTAQHYGLAARYRSNDMMLVLSVLVSLSGFLFFAPGAVYIEGAYMTRKQGGLVATAGPLSNLIVAAAVLPAWLLVPVPSPFWAFLVATTFSINAWIALFNLIPFGHFDGKKIVSWSKPVYALLVTAAVALVIFVFI